MTSRTVENWAPVLGFEGVYEVSTLGRVRRLSQASARIKRIHPRRDYEPKIVTPVINVGYHYVTFSFRGKVSRRSIHSTVLETFVGPRPPGLYACHRDGNKGNNHLTNLKWATSRENQYDRVIHGHGQNGESNGSSKLTEQDVRKIREIRRVQRLPYHKIAKQFNCTKGNIHLICAGRSWASVI